MDADDATTRQEMAGNSIVLVSHAAPAIVLATLQRWVDDRRVLGSPTIFGNEPVLTGRVAAASFHLGVRYQGAGSLGERSTWTSTTTGQVLAEGAGSRVEASFANPAGCFIRGFLIVVVLGLAAFGAFAALLLAAGAQSNGAEIAIPIFLIVMVLAVTYLYKWGARRERRDRDLLAATLADAARNS